MYLSETCQPGLQNTHGEAVALQMVNVEVLFNNILAETLLTQTFCNREQEPIEAVYTFPLASTAVLLDLQLAIGKRHLSGLVTEKNDAETAYEEAIADGDSPIMLEKLNTGLYTMNVGNILPGEEFKVTLRYAELHDWHDTTLRFHLPTTIAPRYGMPEDSGLEQHQIPESDLFTEHRFHLQMTLTGNLACAEVASPSHPIAVSEKNGHKEVTLFSGNAFMDRDFILTVCLPSTARSMAEVDRDLDSGYVAVASFMPNLPAPATLPAKSIKIVIDCSGSMAGDSITQARQAVSDILGQLRQEDFFNIIAFGDQASPLFAEQTQATKQNLSRAHRKLRSMDATLGGTEMQRALETAVTLPGPNISQNIFLITDGEFWQSKKLIEWMKTTNHRVFTIGVGSSVAEGFVRDLAEATHGACELVVPNEGMSDKIVRHFQRLFRPRLSCADIQWPGTPLENIPEKPGQIFDGDTVALFARFAEPPVGSVTLTVEQSDGTAITQSVSLCRSEQAIPPESSSPGTLARMAASLKLQELEAKEACQLAIRYQLISSWTNYLIIHTRAEDEKSLELPHLRKVPQMLAAGWGGTGTVKHRLQRAYHHCQESFIHVDEPTAYYTADSPQQPRQIFFSRALSAEQIHSQKQQTTPERFIFNCNNLHTRWLQASLQLTTLDNLLACDLPDRIADALRDIKREKHPQINERELVTAFLLILQTKLKTAFNRNLNRALILTSRQRPIDRQLLATLEKAFADVQRDTWGSHYPLSHSRKRSKSYAATYLHPER